MRIFGKSGATGRRTVPRAQVPIVATVSSSVGEQRAVPIDISRTGARLGGANLPAVGEQLTFQAAGVEAHGDVVWQDEERCAVEFATPIASAEVQQVRSAGALQ